MPRERVLFQRLANDVKDGKQRQASRRKLKVALKKVSHEYVVEIPDSTRKVWIIASETNSKLPTSTFRAADHVLSAIRILAAKVTNFVETALY